ncbi:MAG: hypothetical protein AAFW66_00120 [Pseudomonadota bacterium]
MKVRSSRVASALPQGLPSKEQPLARQYRFKAPVKGWYTNTSLADPSGSAAYILDDWFPEKEGMRLRGGLQRHATLPSGLIESFFSYQGASLVEFFAGMDGRIFNVTSPADPNAELTPVITGQTSNDYSAVQFATAGGEFLPIVNGSDPMFIYDGSTFNVTDAATHTITVDAVTSDFTDGETLTGGTSAATATIVSSNIVSGAGTIRINNVSGTFQDNETVTDGSGGSATSNIPSGITATAFTTSGSGVTTSQLSFVVSFKNRLFFVKKNTRDAYYLPVDSVAGTLSQFSLNGIFKNGGSLLFIDTWSTDSGDGLDDRIVFFSDLGEAVVYQGTDPGDANNWQLVGRYDISKPLGSKAVMTAGGDLIVATTEGMVPLSEATRKDPAVLSLSAVSRPIEPDWKEAALRHNTRPWTITKWAEKNLAIVSIPIATDTVQSTNVWGVGAWGDISWGDAVTQVVLTEQPFCYVVNIETGAWCRYTGWDTQASIVVDGQVYIGTSDGRVLAAESTGQDDGENYTGRFASLFEDMGASGVLKSLRNARATFQFRQQFNPTISVSTNYQLTWPTAPNAATETNGQSLWDSAIWDQSTWDSLPDQQISTRWRSLAGLGYAVAFQIQVTSGSTIAPDVLFISSDVTYEQGSLVN